MTKVKLLIFFLITLTIIPSIFVFGQKENFLPVCCPSIEQIKSIKTPLKYGDKGKDVEILKLTLSCLGYPVQVAPCYDSPVTDEASNYYGKETKNAVKEFLKDVGVRQSGSIFDLKAKKSLINKFVSVWKLYKNKKYGFEFRYLYPYQIIEKETKEGFKINFKPPFKEFDNVAFGSFEIYVKNYNQIKNEKKFTDVIEPIKKFYSSQNPILVYQSPIANEFLLISKSDGGINVIKGMYNYSNGIKNVELIKEVSCEEFEQQHEEYFSRKEIPNKTKIPMIEFSFGDAGNFFSRYLIFLKNYLIAIDYSITEGECQKCISKVKQKYGEYVYNILIGFKRRDELLASFEIRNKNDLLPVISCKYHELKIPEGDG